MAFNFYPNNYSRFGTVLDKIKPPCFGLVSVETGAKIVAIIQLVQWALFSVGFMFAAIIVYSIAIARENALKDLEPDAAEQLVHSVGAAAVIIFAMLALVSGGFVYLQHYLLLGIKTRNLKKVNRWWKIMLVATLSLALLNIMSALSSRRETKYGISEIISFLFDVYSLWVIHVYRTELEAQTSDTTVEFERVL